MIAELWRGLRNSRGGSRGRADGAPGARNVNWEDCFNKALTADAGRGLAGGATQTGGQHTERLCQQTSLEQYEAICVKTHCGN